MKSIRVGSGSAGWPDMIDPALVVADRGNIDYMAFDHLAELTMAILERQKVKDPSKGYIPDVIPLMKQLLPIWNKNGRRFKMVSNGGGANPPACTAALTQVAKDLGLEGMKIATITGDDIPLARLDELAAKGMKFTNLDTGEDTFAQIREKLMAAYVYVGAERVTEALHQGADLVVGGRLSDNSLFIGPFMHGLGWKFEDAYWDRIGAGVSIGHLLECAGWSTGICSTHWDEVPEPWNLGFPIAEVFENGDAIIQKAPDTGGLVSEWTLKEHLLYEVHDPHNYIMPDGIADITAINLTQVGENRVKVSRAGDRPRGKARPATLKLCLAYMDGYAIDYMMVVGAPRALEQAKRVEEYVHKRLAMTGIKPREILVSFVGVNSLHGPAAPWPDYEMNEVGVRIAIKCNTQEEASVLNREASLSWFAAGVGAAFGSPKVRPLFALYPTLIPRECVPLDLQLTEIK